MYKFFNSKLNALTILKSKDLKEKKIIKKEILRKKSPILLIIIALIEDLFASTQENQKLILVSSHNLFQLFLG
jgi:hypothetical protein